MAAKKTGITRAIQPESFSVAEAGENRINPDDEKILATMCTPQEREIVIMHICGWSQAEIAEQLDFDRAHICRVLKRPHVVLALRQTKSVHELRSGRLLNAMEEGLEAGINRLREDIESVKTTPMERLKIIEFFAERTSATGIGKVSKSMSVSLSGVLKGETIQELNSKAQQLGLQLKQAVEICDADSSA